MKILHLTNVYGDGGGGAALTVDSLCRLLESKGHENPVLYGSQTGKLPEQQRTTLFIKDICDFQVNTDLDKLAQALSFVEQQKPDIIQFHQIGNDKLVSYLAKRYPSVMYLYNHVLVCSSGSLFYPDQKEICPLTIGKHCIVNNYTKRCGTRKPIEVIKSYVRGIKNNQAAHEVSKLIAISHYVKTTLVAAGYNHSKIDVIHSLSPLVTASNTDLNTAYPQESNIILFAGRITEVKGLEVLISCLPLLKQDWRLVVVGSGYRLPGAIALAAELGLQNRIEFKQWVAHEDMKELYEQAALVVVPSIYPEPLGLIGVEAMYYSRPTVAFDVGGISDWLEDGYNGFLCHYHDTTDMANKIDRLLADKVLAAKMGTNGKLKFQIDFNSDHIYNEFINCYKELIGN